MINQMEKDFRRLYRERVGKAAEDIINLCAVAGLPHAVALQIIAVESLSFVASLTSQFTSMTEQDFVYFTNIAFRNARAEQKREQS